MLRLIGLHKTFPSLEGPVTVIEGIDLEVPEGECYALLGPSGCGKTTTLRCVAGLEHPDAGSIEVGGQTVCDTQRGIFVPTYRRSIGMVFQSYAIWPHLDVFDNIAYPLRVQRPRPSKQEIEARVMDMLSIVGMRTMSRHSATRLSGGQQQRVALARALVRRPSLLLLDEPLSNLDARLREQMRNELRELIYKVGVTALYVTHDQSEAFALAHRVAVMTAGRIVQEGPPRRIYHDPGSAFVATFLGAANVLAARVAARGRNGQGEIALEGGAALTLRAPVPQDSVPGEAVQLVVRPEDVDVLVHRPDDTRAAAPARVEWVSFQGSQCECGLRLGALLVRAALHPARDLREGDEVWLRLNAARCVTFAKGS